MDSDSQNKKEHPIPSSSDLFSSAKLLAEAAQTSLSDGYDKVDKSKVAGAASDILDAASRYGKFEDKAFGGYVEKANSYLHQYESSNPTTTKPGSKLPTTTTTTTTDAADKTSKSEEDGGDKSGGGYGGYVKMAEGFLKPGSKPPTTTTDAADKTSKSEEDGGDKSGGGYGNYVKMAEGFFK
ncbi:unnamed protein product [Ilex paraguariensis]|uniref:Nodulin-related protein 1 n=1 Tax=Ilex paraguariensis TaxID=185542 RepID=A0ABC8UYR1_9AQUA